MRERAAKYARPAHGMIFDPKQMGEIIRAHRMLRGLSMRLLAAKSGITSPTIKRMECGEIGKVQLDFIVKVLGVLGISLQEVFVLDKKANPPLTLETIVTDATRKGQGLRILAMVTQELARKPKTQKQKARKQT